jgi:hypothetical protein
MKKYQRCLVPLLIGIILSVSFGLMLWAGFFFVFIPIGLGVSIVFFISIRRKAGIWEEKSDFQWFRWFFRVF